MITPITWLFDSGDREEKLFLCFCWNEKQDSSHSLSVHAPVSPSSTRRISFPRAPFYHFSIGFEQSLESSFALLSLSRLCIHSTNVASIEVCNFYSAAVEVLCVRVTGSPERHHDNYGLHHSLGVLIIMMTLCVLIPHRPYLNGQINPPHCKYSSTDKGNPCAHEIS